MRDVSKFMFDLQFNGSAAAAPNGETVEDEVEAPVFSEAEVQAAREDGYAAGLAAAQDQAEQSMSRQIVLSLSAVEDGVRGLMAAGDAARQARLRDIAVLARAIARKVAGDAIAEAPEAVIEAMAKSCVDQLYGQPAVTLRVPPALLEPLSAKLAPLTAAVADTGRFEIVGDAALDGADCRLDWTNGHAERSGDALWAEIERMIGQFDLDQPLDTTAPSATETPDEPAPPIADPVPEPPDAPEELAIETIAPDQPPADTQATLADALGPELAAARAAAHGDAATESEPGEPATPGPDADPETNPPTDTGASDGGDI